MKENKFKITMSELKQIIAEEYNSTVEKSTRVKEIQDRLKTINEEISTLPETLEEVEASGTKKVKATGWTGAGEGDVKYGEKFEKIGSHLKEEDEIEGEIEIGGSEEEPADEMGFFEMEFAKLGKAMDAKMPNASSMEDEAEEETIEVPDMGLDMGGDSEEEEEEEELEEGGYAELQPDEEGGMQKVNEDLEEPIEGDSPAQDSEARFNDDMKKDTHVNEGVKGGAGILSEGKSVSQVSALNKELERMKQLAKIGK